MFPATGVRATLSYRESDAAVRQILGSFRSVAHEEAFAPPRGGRDQCGARGLPAPGAAPAASAAAGPAAGLRRLRGTERVDDGDVAIGVAVHLRRHLHRRRQPRVRAAEPRRGRGSRPSPGRAGSSCRSGSGRRRRARRWVRPPRSAAIPTSRRRPGSPRRTAAANAADALGFRWLAPVYYDMEAYPRGGACTAAVISFADGWVYGLNVRGYLRRLLQQPLLRDPRRRRGLRQPELPAVERGLDRGVEQHAEHLRVRRPVRALRCHVVEPPARAPVHRRAQRDVRRCDHQHRLQRGRRPHLALIFPMCTRRFATLWRRGDVAQLARAPALQAGGRGFESHRLHQARHRVCSELSQPLVACQLLIWVMSITSAGPVGRCSRYCRYLRLRRSIASSRVAPPSTTRPRPEIRTHHNADQSSS